MSLNKSNFKSCCSIVILILRSFVSNPPTPTPTPTPAPNMSKYMR